MDDDTLLKMLDTRIAAAKSCKNNTEEIYMKSIKIAVNDLIKQKNYYKSLFFAEDKNNET